MDKYCPKCFKEFSAELDRCPDDNAKLVSTVEENLAGRNLDDRYQVISKLGQGGMGVVYIAEQAMIGRRVALKVLRMEMARDKALVKRFLTEARAIASLKNAHTITLFDFGISESGLLYYTMELLEGQSLSDAVNNGPIPLDRAANIIMQALESLEEAHEHEILHRDIKPDNIFLTYLKGEERVTVLDFGIAKLAGDQSMETITQTGMICGTPAYLSPEQALGNPARPASDLYSLAIVLYEMLAGEPPFQETTPMKVLLKHLNDRPDAVNVRNPDVRVPGSIDDFLQKALAKRPEDRFPDVPAFKQAFIEATRNIKSDTVPLAPMTTTSQGTRTIPKLIPTDSIPTPDANPAMSHPTPDANPAMSHRGTGAVDEMAPTIMTPSAGTEAVLEFAKPARKGLWLGLGGLALITAATVVFFALWNQGGSPNGSPTDVSPRTPLPGRLSKNPSANPLFERSACPVPPKKTPAWASRNQSSKKRKPPKKKTPAWASNPLISNNPTAACCPSHVDAVNSPTLTQSTLQRRAAPPPR